MNGDSFGRTQLRVVLTRTKFSSRSRTRNHHMLRRSRGGQYEDFEAFSIFFAKVAPVLYLDRRLNGIVALGAGAYDNSQAGDYLQ